MKCIFKKATALTLFLCIILSVASCSSDNGTTKENATTAPTVTEPVETEAERILPDLPDEVFGGADFRFYSWDIDGWRPWNDIWVEDQNGEPINDAVFMRNSYIEQKYDININFQYDHYQTYEANVKKVVNANEDAYDVLISMGHCIPRLYTSNVFYNLHSIDYLDFDKPWWDQNAVESFTLAGYMPFTVSDMIILDKASASCVYFNKKIAEDYNIGSNLYDEVYNNTWTIARIIELGKKVSDDLNGDSVYDDYDRYGIICGDDPVYQLFHSAGGRYVTKDANDYPQLSFQSEYNFTVIQYYLENLMYDPLLTHNNSFVSGAIGIQEMFKNNQSLFMFSSLKATNDLREMEADFGILPIPKYDSSQKNYSCSSSVFGGNLISVPITCRNTDMVGIILEAMSAESKYSLIPAFYDTVLKDKSTRDAESTDMLDIIINNMVFDVGDYYNLADFPDCFLRITGSAAALGRDKRTSDIASFYEKYAKKTQKALDDLIEIIDDWKAMDS